MRVAPFVLALRPTPGGGTPRQSSGGYNIEADGTSDDGNESEGTQSEQQATINAVDARLRRDASVDIKTYTAWSLSDAVPISTFNDGGILPEASHGSSVPRCEAALTRYFNIPLARSIKNASGKQITADERAKARLGSVSILRCRGSGRVGIRSMTFGCAAHTHQQQISGAGLKVFRGGPDEIEEETAWYRAHGVHTAPIEIDGSGADPFTVYVNFTASIRLENLMPCPVAVALQSLNSLKVGTEEEIRETEKKLAESQQSL